MNAYLIAASSKRDSSAFLLVLSSWVSAFHVLQRAHLTQNFPFGCQVECRSPASVRHGLAGVEGYDVTMLSVCWTTADPRLLVQMWHSSGQMTVTTLEDRREMGLVTLIQSELWVCCLKSAPSLDLLTVTVWSPSSVRPCTEQS